MSKLSESQSKSRWWQRGSHWLRLITAIVTTTSVTSCHHRVSLACYFSPLCTYQYFTCVMPSFQETADAILVFTMNPEALTDTQHNFLRINFNYIQVFFFQIQQKTTRRTCVFTFGQITAGLSGRHFNLLKELIQALYFFFN